jgi:phospholipid-translocating ATPase
MIDGIYQSVIVFFITWLLFHPAMNVSSNGLDINDTGRLGSYVASSAIVVVNVYILMNTYRWDWLMVTLACVSALLIFFWTGVYSCFTAGAYFYHTAQHVYGQPTFWAVTLLTVAICLLPRFAAKAFQKIFLPYDVDVIREQIRQGKFKHLDEVQPGEVASQVIGKHGTGAMGEGGSAPGTSSATAVASPTTAEHGHLSMDEDRKPIYPPSVSQTTNTHNDRSQNGSDGTDYITARPISIEAADRERELGRRPLSGNLSPIEALSPATTNERPPLDRTLTPHSPMLERMTTPLSRPLSQVSTGERPRPSFERLRTSMDRTRPSFENFPDMTSAAQLSRVESRHSEPNSPVLSPTSPLRGRREFPLSPLGHKGGYDR